jgi:phosphoribosylamine--glycine ligase
VILASAGYPATSRNGDEIGGLTGINDSRIFHCGTRKNAAGAFETNGGRVLAIVAQGPTRAAARGKVYDSVAKVTFNGRQARSDIAKLHFE